MTTRSEPRATFSARRLLFALLLTYAYFVGAPAWNQSSRFALTRAIVERGSVIIDADHITTGDKAYREGHFYSDKAPAAAVVSIVPYAAYVQLLRGLGRPRPSVTLHPLDPRSDRAGAIDATTQWVPGDRLGYNVQFRTALYLCTLIAAALPTVAICAGLRSLVEPVAGTWTSVLVVLAYGLATPAFAYSTALYGHQLSAAGLFTGFVLVVQNHSVRPYVGLIAGAMLGLAVAAEYPALPMALLLTLYGVRRHGYRFAFRMVAGGLPWAGALAFYHAQAFGSPWATGYDFVYGTTFAEGMAVHYGFARPSSTVLFAITYGSYRGLFYVSPVLLLAFWGLTLGVLRNPRDSATIAFVVVAYYLVLSSGYYMWDGGASVGPRHVLPAVPFLVLGLPAAIRVSRLAFFALAIVSVFQSAIFAASGPEVAQFGNPLWESALPEVLTKPVGLGSEHSNLGLLIGLPGIWSLLPLLLVWGWLVHQLRSAR